MNHYSLEIKAVGDVMFQGDAMTKLEVYRELEKHGIFPEKAEWETLNSGEPVEFTDVILPLRTVTLMGFQDQDYKPEDAPENKHTPAPWTARKNENASLDNNPHVEYWIDGPGGTPVADIKTHGKEATTADMHLITAAPELFEALQALANSAKDAISEQPQKDWRQSLADGLDLALDVLRKAKGETE